MNIVLFLKESERGYRMSCMISEPNINNLTPNSEKCDHLSSDLVGRKGTLMMCVTSGNKIVVECYLFYVAPCHKFCLTDLTVSKFARKYDVLF
jgi:hypothetical protein